MKLILESFQSLKDEKSLLSRSAQDHYLSAFLPGCFYVLHGGVMEDFLVSLTFYRAISQDNAWNESNHLPV